MVLHDLVHEVPLWEVARRYQYNKGTLQSLQQAAATFAGNIFIPYYRIVVAIWDHKGQLTVESTDR